MPELTTFFGALNMIFTKDPFRATRLKDARKESEMASIKLIREWSGESFTIREIKSGLDTWFNERDINNKSNTLKILLDEYITIIYKNEIEFVTKFLPEFTYFMKLYEVSFSSERIRLVIVNDDGSHVSTSIRTDIVFDWIDKL